MQTKQLHIRLAVDEISDLDALARDAEMNATALAGYFMRASIRAAKSYGRRIRVPLDFEIIDSEPLLPASTGGRMQLNEPKPKTARK